MPIKYIIKIIRQTKDMGDSENNKENFDSEEQTDTAKKPHDRYKILSVILAVLLVISVALGFLAAFGVIGKRKAVHQEVMTTDTAETTIAGSAVETDALETIQPAETSTEAETQENMTEEETTEEQTTEQESEDNNRNSTDSEGGTGTSGGGASSPSSGNGASGGTTGSSGNGTSGGATGSSGNGTSGGATGSSGNGTSGGSTPAPSGNGNSGTGTPSGGSQTGNVTPSGPATFTAEFSVVNSWESNGKKAFQYSISIKNTSQSVIKSWKVETDMPAGTTLSQSWGCECELSGTGMVLKPVDYTSEIAAGATKGDIGLIIECPSDPGNFSVNGTTDDVSQGDGNNGNSNGNGGNSGGSTAPTTPVVPYVPPVLEAGTPVGNHGQLRVSGTDLVDKNGQKYQLKGVSTHGIAWFPDYVNADAFRTLRDNWGANLVRIAMYTDEYGGYCSGGNKDNLESLVSKGVEACTDLGMYVIIDWHVLNDHNPNNNIADAKVFFDRMSRKYASNVNVIYEICNEPNDGTTWADIKKYADVIIPIIRKNSPNAVIIVGTPTWSQDVDQVAANPPAITENVMYAVHFYAATHGDNIRNKVKTAIAAGTPVFISEFSICDASGNGGIDYNSAEIWKNLINSYNLSYAGWSLCNKAETSALISSGCSKLSGWETSELSATGQWLRNMIAGN